MASFHGGVGILSSMPPFRLASGWLPALLGDEAFLTVSGLADTISRYLGLHTSSRLHAAWGGGAGEREDAPPSSVSLLSA